ncbi:MAG: hypothetical protein H6Q91_2144 [Deltaproteobacteria bacterium]|nr:hypothetical protein [Deltaproteobacteria bacterium]
MFHAVTGPDGKNDQLETNPVRIFRNKGVASLRGAEHEAVIDLRELRLLRGSLPRRAMALALEWVVEHRDELMEDWERCRRLRPPKPIPPLR